MKQLIPQQTVKPGYLIPAVTGFISGAVLYIITGIVMTAAGVSEKLASVIQSGVTLVIVLLLFILWIKNRNREKQHSRLN